MSTLTTQKDRMSQESSDLRHDESVYINRILDTLLTIPPQYWRVVMRTVTRWVEAGLTSDKEEETPKLSGQNT